GWVMAVDNTIRPDTRVPIDPYPEAGEPQKTQRKPAATTTTDAPKDPPKDRYDSPGAQTQPKTGSGAEAIANAPLAKQVAQGLANYPNEEMPGVFAQLSQLNSKEAAALIKDLSARGITVEQLTLYFAQFHGIPELQQGLAPVLARQSKADVD